MLGNLVGEFGLRALVRKKRVETGVEFRRRKKSGLLEKKYFKSL